MSYRRLPIVIDDEATDNEFVTYHGAQGTYDNYGLGLAFQYIVSDTDSNGNIKIDFGSGKATYSFPKPSKILGNGDYATAGFPINFSSFSNNTNADLARNTWFYSMRVENFRGFEENSLNEFVFSMLPLYKAPNRDFLPAFRVNAKWVNGLYKGKKYNNTLVMSALAQRYGKEIEENEDDPGAHGDIIWESGVGYPHPASEILTNGIAPGNTVLDIGVKVTESGSVSSVELYYRLFEKGVAGIQDGMSYDSGGWRLFHTIPIPNATGFNGATVKFPGFPLSLSSYSVQSETTSFEVEPPASATIRIGGVEAIDKTELEVLGVRGAEPISTKESFELSEITAGSTVVLRYGLSREALTDENIKPITLGNVEMKKIFSDQRNPINFTYTQVADPSDLEDGQWDLRSEGNINVILLPDTRLNANINTNNSKNYFVYFAIGDGGQFDLDGEANGTIVDPNILVLPDSSGSGGGSGGGGSGGGSGSGSGGGGSGGSGESEGTSTPTPGTNPDPVNTTPSSDGKVNISLPVAVPEGKTITAVQIDTNSDVLNELEGIGLTATVDAENNVRIDGVATDIGVFSIPVTVTLSDGSVVTESVTVTINAIENVTESAIDVSDTKRITSTLSTNADNSVKVVLVSPLDIGSNSASAIKDLAVQASGMTVESANLSESSALNARGAGSVNLTVVGKTTSVDSARITSVSYRAGINRYTQALDISVIKDTSVVDNRKTSGGSGSGCDTGIGTLVALTCALCIAKKRKAG